MNLIPTRQDALDWLEHPVTRFLMEDIIARKATANAVTNLHSITPKHLERELGRALGLAEAYDYVILLPERMKSIRQNREANNGRSGT
jgi:hypothetical protein